MTSSQFPGYDIDGPEPDTGVTVDTLQEARAELLSRGVPAALIDSMAGGNDPSAYIGHERDSQDRPPFARSPEDDAWHRGTRGETL